MKWRTMLAVGAVLLMLLLQFRHPGAAYACSCGDLSLEEEFDLADAVFQGVAVDIQPLGGKWKEANVTFSVSTSWKGSYQTMVLRQSNPGSCTDYPFAEGNEYIVFAYDDFFARGEDLLYSSICGFTDEASARMQARLKSIQPNPQSPPAAGPFPWIWLALAAGAVAGVWRWRRRRARAGRLL